MDKIKDKIEEIVEKVKSDKDFAKKFKEDPIKAIEEVIGMDLPEDKIKEVANLVSTKLKLDDNKIVGKLKGFFD